MEHIIDCKTIRKRLKDAIKIEDIESEEKRKMERVKIWLDKYTEMWTDEALVDLHGDITHDFGVIQEYFHSCEHHDR